MELSDDEFRDEYDDMEIDEETAHLLDQAPVDLGAPRPLSDFKFGSEEYCRNYRKALALETKKRTELDPFDWQLAGCSDPTMTMFLLSPLNALANSQAKEFNDWGLKAVAVNASTKYPHLKMDILKGKFRIIISSIEAFTDTTRLLPIVKSPQLAALGPQRIIVDEAHCISKWGPQFRPQYALVGTLRLVLTGEVSMVAATATANNHMRQAIKQSLRFGSNAFEVNLGNRRPNIAYTVHRVRNVSTIATELLEYFPSKSELPEFTIIFVDSRKLGASLLESLRQHLDPELRESYPSERPAR